MFFFTKKKLSLRIANITLVCTLLQNSSSFNLKLGLRGEHSNYEIGYNLLNRTKFTWKPRYFKHLCVISFLVSLRMFLIDFAKHLPLCMKLKKKTIQYEILPSGLRLARCPPCWCSVQEKSRCRWQLSSWCNLVEFQIHICISISALLRYKADFSNLMIQKYLLTSWPPIQWFEMLIWVKSLPWFFF